MATHSTVLSWRIPGMGEFCGRPSMGSHRVRHDWSDLAAAEVQWDMMFLMIMTYIKSSFFLSLNEDWDFIVYCWCVDIQYHTVFFEPQFYSVYSKRFTFISLWRICFEIDFYWLHLCLMYYIDENWTFTNTLTIANRWKSLCISCLDYIFVSFWCRNITKLETPLSLKIY